jgi:hypothetical protein
MLLLTLSHPYTSIEVISIILAWVTLEYFYFKNTEIKKKDFLFILFAFLAYFIYYGVILNRMEIYRQINKINALDWGYKAWHFVPAYAIVWLLCLLTVKNIPALKKQLANSHNRLFLAWGIVAFLLSVHGFAIKPVQPIHFTRGYVYSGFFLFGLPALQYWIHALLQKGWKGYLMIGLFIFLFLFDNITWFGTAALEKNQSGVYYTTAEKEVIQFFQGKKEHGIVIGNEKNYELDAGIQLFSPFKSWIPHPFLTLDINEKRAAVDSLFKKGKIADSWKTSSVYMYSGKKDSNLQISGYSHVFENSQYIIYKIR